MAAYLSLACDTATEWYHFTYPLSWSNNCEVAEVLSDIPFISVGILVISVSVMFLVIRRVSLSAVWLFLSSLLAFVAAALDLGQTLADGMAMTATLVASEPIVRATEVLLALSIGFRFLFYWSYVAEPPRKDLSAASTQQARTIRILTLEYTREPHSGSWMRWGLPGKLLGVGLLVTIITITALQSIWRVVPQSHQYGNIYATDAALELLVSFFLLLKLLSNTVTLNLPDGILVHTFRESLAPISGLLVNIAIGVGNLLYFAFTESTLGRLLQAFEICILVVFVVVTAFLRHRDILLSSTSSQGRKRGDVVFTLPEPARESPFRIPTPFIETPRMSTILGIANQNKESSQEALRRSARRSLNHVSSWISSRVSRNRFHRGDEEAKLWNVEEVKVDPPYTGNIDMELRASVMSLTQEPEAWTELVHDASANHIPFISALDAQSAIARSMEGSIHSGQILHPRADVPQRPVSLRVRTSPVPVSSVPLSVSSGTKHTGCTPVPAEASPVYGLGGIPSLASASNSRTSLDELLRQQSQLDKSIEALKLFSTRKTTDSSHSNPPLNRGSAELTRSPSTDQRTISSSVSLSNFPIPPWLTTPIPSPPSSCSSSIKRIREDRRVRLAAARPPPVQDTCGSALSKTSASLVDIPSSPRSPWEENGYLSAEAGKSPRSDSGGTRYNVTSFIDGLATPRQGTQEKPWWPAESKSSVEVIQTSSGMNKLPPYILSIPRRLQGLPASPAAAKISPLAHSSGSSQGDFVYEPTAVMGYQISDQTSHSPKTALSPQSPVIDRAGEGMSIPPTRPQLLRETGLPITVSADGAGRVQRTFVRPRPPPLAIQSYTEQNSGIPRVQVLADD